MMSHQAARCFDLNIIAQQIRVRGLVQGVGFRPTVWRLAKQFHITGQVLNDGEGVLINAWANANNQQQFVQAIHDQAPPLARIDQIEYTDQLLDLDKAPTDFHIEASQYNQAHTGVVADAASCHACIDDSLNKNDHRYRYPFTNCTHCGPRLSIIRAIPYDRQQTSMANFKLCEKCANEYNNPADRRFHAQPNACPDCGPKAWLEPHVDHKAIDDIDACAQLLAQGAIVAIKGIGGFHLVCDATNNKAVSHLRQRKNRYAKPFALMAKDIQTIQKYCLVNEMEQQLLKSSAAPIVLLTKTAHQCLASGVAPAQNTLGFMLPATPLHHLLFAQLDIPLVMTSGNLSQLPQAIKNEEAIELLGSVADYCLLNDRDISNRIDDSVTRVVNGKTQLLRRARGYAPSSLHLPKGFENSPDLLALGGELKNTFCLIKDSQAILSQHMGDLENARVYQDYLHNLSLYQQLYQHQPKWLALDKHPEYLSSKYARERAETDSITAIEIQHHHSHIAACLAENNWPLDAGKVLGIALDGLGFGDDNALWGGEFLIADYVDYQRLGHLKPIALIGSQQAVYQPWRNTYAHLRSAFDWKNLIKIFPNSELLRWLQNKPLKTLDAMLKKELNTPTASSCGRLFDAVAAAIGICRDQVTYEGQAAIELEALVTDELISQQQKYAYMLSINTQQLPYIIEPNMLWAEILSDLDDFTPTEVIATRFHLGLSNAIAEMVYNICETHTLKSKTVVLSGGVFQNQFLLTQVTQQLQQSSFTVLSHSKVPANDGGLALGQAVIALATIKKQQEKQSCA